VRIVVGHDSEGRWWWTAIAEDGSLVATSVLLPSRTDCMRSIAELKVEGPAALVAYADPSDGIPLGR